MDSLATFLSGRKHVIFDWNGTILDDVDMCIETINEVLNEYGLPVIDRQTYRRAFRFPVINYYERLGFDFKRHSWEEVSNKFIEMFNKKVVTCSLFSGVRQLLETAKALNIPCSILSAAHRQHVTELVDHYHLTGYFTHLAGVEDTHARGKLAIGKALMSQLNVTSQDVLLIGDTDHDFAVANALGVDALILADGHQDYSILSSLACRVLETRYNV